VIRSLRRTRFSALLSAATLLCVASLSIASAFHNDTDDPDCNPPLVFHNHAAHHFIAQNGSSTSTPDHCYLCHWTSLRIVHAVSQFYAPSAGSRVLARTVFVGTARGILAGQPSRAPPLA
jgi:hypothetical protein